MIYIDTTVPVSTSLNSKINKHKENIFLMPPEGKIKIIINIILFII